MPDLMEGLALAGRIALILALGALAGAGLLRLFRPGAGRLAHRLQWAAWLLVTGATGLLLGLFLADAFAFTYVAGRSSRSMATIYKVSALWAGQEGSLLLWLWLQSGYALIVSHRAGPGQILAGRAAGILALISAFFALLVAFVVSPFTLHPNPPADGAGMNPILQSYWMTAHPVMLYLGYIGLSVPFAYGAASLMTPSDAWIRLTRRWSLVAWTFLSLGILFGARWAYEELGWGGYWGWDPVENASFMPWLVATAFIHSGLIQEKRGMLKRWNHGLILAAYALTLFGTFITRSGILSSVHAFVESDISPWFIGFIGLVLAGYLYGLARRWEGLADERPIESPLSKEAAFLANNVIFIATAFAIFWGTVFPLVASALGHQVTVGAPYFERVSGPLLWLMIVLMGIGPLIAWRRATARNLQRQFTAPVINGLFMVVWLWVVGLREIVILFSLPAVVFVFTTILMEFARGLGVRMRSRGEPFWLALPRMMNRSPGRYGGYIVHLGVLLMVVGIAASSVYQYESNVVLAVGEEARIAGYTLRLYDLRSTVHGSVPAVEADLLVRNERGPLGFLRPSKRFYPGTVETMGPSTEVAFYTTVRGDLYAVLAGWEPYGSLVGLKLYFNPLVWLIWAGGGLMIFGSLFAFWPRSRNALSESESALASLAELEYDYQMGKVGEAEYAALFAELSEKAEAHLAREAQVAEGVVDAWLRRYAAGGKGLALLLSAAVLSAAPGAPGAAQEAQIGVLSDVHVVSVDGARLSVLNLVTVTHVGAEAVEAVRLAVPENAVLIESLPDGLEPADGGVLLDRRGLAPGESRRYTLRYEMPVVRWPFPLQREVLYPTQQIVLLVDDERLKVSGIDVVRAGSEVVAGAPFAVYQSQWVEAGSLWQAVLKPAPGAGALPGWDPAVDGLGVLAEADSFPGWWLVKGIVELPRAVLAAVAVGLGAAAGALWRRERRSAAGARGGAAREGGLLAAGAAGKAAAAAEVERLVRSLARLAIAREEGAVSGWAYRRRRALLERRLRAVLEGAEGGDGRGLLVAVREELRRDRLSAQAEGSDQANARD